MVRQQPEFIYRETARHLITRPFRWFHYPLALSFHKDINSPTRWLVRVNALPRGTPRRFIEIRIRKSGRGGVAGEEGAGNFRENSMLQQRQQLRVKRSFVVIILEGGRGIS